jgi:type VI secretion system secreted protein VgrG
MKKLFTNGAIAVFFIIFLSLVNGLSYTGVLAEPNNPALPTLGTAKQFAVLGGSTVTNTGATVVTGNLGVSPGTAVTGFPPGNVTGAIHSVGAVPLTAQNDATTAYVDLAGRPCDTNLTGQDLGLQPALTAGVYCFDSEAQLTGDLVLDAEGDPAAVFIFQIVSKLTTASDATVSVINSGKDCNVFWQIGSSATLGTGTQFIGNILAYANIALNTDANLSGRALARTEAVNMDDNNISIVQCADPTAIGLSSFSGSSPAMVNISSWLILLLGFLGLTFWLLRIRSSAKS